MFEGQFPQLSKLVDNRDTEHLEQLIEVCVDPNTNVKDLVNHYKDSGAVRFIVDENFKLCLTTSYHSVLAERLNIDRSKALIPDGYFNLSYKNTVEFVYAQTGRYTDSTKSIQKAAENKIKIFFKI